MTASEYGRHRPSSDGRRLTPEQVERYLAIRRGSRRPKIEWSAEQDQFIASWYGLLDHFVIAAHLGRTPRQIYERAACLGCTT